MKRVSELEGAELDYWVGRALTLPDIRISHDFYYSVCVQDQPYDPIVGHDFKTFEPSSEWAHGGPLIEEWDIGIYRIADTWFADSGLDGPEMGGSTPLEAACRAIVASVYGEYVGNN
jgi:hypothetical protein